MAHIRAKFAATAKMDAYDRKKYMWKVLYMYMLGYEIDFGHMEAVNLVTTHTYSEKSCVRAHRTGCLQCCPCLRSSHWRLRVACH